MVGAVPQNPGRAASREFEADGPPGVGDFPAPPGMNPLFRALRYGADYAGLAGKDLTPGKTIEELQSQVPNQE